MNKKIGLSLPSCLFASLLIGGCSQQQTQQNTSVAGQQTMDHQIPKKVTPEPVSKPVKVHRPMVKPKQVHKVHSKHVYKVRPMVKPKQVHKVHAKHVYKVRPMVKPKQVHKVRPMYHSG